MPPITLYDAAFNSLIRQKWKNSFLQNLLIEANLEIELTSPSANSALLKRNEFTQLVMTICNDILQSDFLPYIIKNNFASAFYEIAFEIETFLGSLVSSLKEVNKEKITFFLQRIIISQHGEIDKKNSILKIIGDSKFAYKFSNTVLIRNCIETPDLDRLSREVVNLEKAQPNSERTIPQIQYDINESMKIMVLPTIEKFIYAQIELQHGNENFTNVVLYGENVNVIKLVYENEKPAEKQDFLLRLSYYAFKKNLLFSASFAVFLYENLDEQVWQDILRRFFNEVFWILLGSRRYRHYMLTWFRQAIPTMSCETYIQMIFNEEWNSSTLVLHEYYAMENLFKKIWDETPDKFKHKHSIRQAVIKSIVYVFENVKILEYVLRDYNQNIQTQLLKQCILHYIITQAGDSLPEVGVYVKKLVKVGVNLGLPEDAIVVGANVEELKCFVLAMDGSKANLLCYERQVSAQAFKANQCGFKVNLLKENGFIELILLKHWLTKNIRCIILWCADFNSKACNQYLLRLDQKIYERVYEKVLLAEGSIAIADRGFIALQLCEQQVQCIKVNVLSKPKVRKHLLTTYFRNGFFDFVEQWQLFYIRIEDDIHRFFRDIFVMDYGKEAVWEFILYIEGSLTIMQQMDQLNVFIVFCQKIAYRYDLCEVIRYDLMGSGHPNLRNAPITYQGRTPTPQELPELRKVVDFRYRTLLALLYGSSSTLLYNYRLITVTDVSLVLAQAVGLDIPVVF